MTNVSRISSSELEDKIKDELTKSFDSKRKRIFTKIVSAALGTIPWVGGFLSTTIDFNSNEGQVKTNQLYEQWLQEHSNKMRLLGETIVKILNRLDEFSEEIDERLESEEFSQLVKKSFRIWDNADTEEKRNLVKMVLTNAGTSKLVSDDLLRLFLDWINLYHEAHFSIIKVIYQNSGSTRFDIWQELGGTIHREDSLEADLFKLLIRDLSMGGVIRQCREVDYLGNFKKKDTKKNSSSSGIMKSAFDDSEQYELTELGEKFVHYTMDDVVSQIK